ncbi:HpcH/HpaI aldolase family protein [Microvirga massiliensis]|uniref:HpcH/HpaI aldolase family protein n=1 Tax=Microvirga massiliensis TaxID=1033741 RepID=UPI00062B5385|nr:aldolase/citrate lyase family protein [Microvirga massiliensis]
MSSNSAPESGLFRQRFLGQKPLMGTFIKTPSVHATEILGGLGFDFVVIDEEHAPFDRETIDLVLLAARAAGTAGIVRVAEPTASKILSVLDCGAAGVLVPHVSSAAKAQEIAAAARYRGGKRGFSNSPRAGGYGTLSIWQHVDAGDAAATVIAMIEDPEALDEIEAIAAVDGLDGFFIGRGDLTVALGAPAMDAPAVRIAVERIAAAAQAAGKPVCVMANSVADAEAMKALGASAFIVSSDQGLMRQAALKVLADFTPVRADA